MKLEIIKDLTLTETLIKIYTAHIDRKTQNIIDFIKEDTSYIHGFWQEKCYLIKPDDIIRLYTDGKKIKIETSEKTYTSKQRIFQLEELLPVYSVKLSQSELANIRHIQKLDLHLKGTIEVTFKTGQTSFVSRRSIKNFKHALGI